MLLKSRHTVKHYKNALMLYSPHHWPVVIHWPLGSQSRICTWTHPALRPSERLRFLKNLISRQVWGRMRTGVSPTYTLPVTALILNLSFGILSLYTFLYWFVIPSDSRVICFVLLGPEETLLLEHICLPLNKWRIMYLALYHKLTRQRPIGWQR